MRGYDTWRVDRAKIENLSEDKRRKKSKEELGILLDFCGVM